MSQKSNLLHLVLKVSFHSIPIWVFLITKNPTLTAAATLGIFIPYIKTKKLESKLMIRENEEIRKTLSFWKKLTFFK